MRKPARSQATTPGRLPDLLLADWSSLRLKRTASGCSKFLLYYDVDEALKINHLKHVFIERLGSECERRKSSLLFGISFLMTPN